MNIRDAWPAEPEEAPRPLWQTLTLAAVFAITLGVVLAALAVVMLWGGPRAGGA